MKEISFTKIDKIIKATTLPRNTTITLNAGDEAVEVEVKQVLTLQERTDMAFEIADIVFPEDGRAVSYIPSFLEYAHAFACFKYFTNLKEDTNVERVLAFERATAMVSRIQEVSLTPLGKIFDEANQIIEYRKQCAAHSKAVMDELHSLLGTANAVFSSMHDDNRVPLEDIVQALQSVQDVDEESLSRGVLEFHKEQTQSEAVEAATGPVLLSKG